MSRLKNFLPIFSSPGIIFHILLISQVILFLIFLFRPFTLIPPGKMYPVIDKNFFYTDVIRQGKDGSWRMFENHTTLYSPRIFAYLFFIFLGKIAAIISMEPVWMYLWSRVIFGITAFYATLWFVLKFLPKGIQTLSLLFILGIEAGPLISTLPELKPLWEGRILVLRNFGLPHHLFAQATGMIFIGYLLLLAQKLTRFRVVALVISGLLSMISMPAYLFTFALTVFPTWVVWALVYKKIKPLIAPLILATIIILAPNILFAIEFAKGPPWNNSAVTEKTWFTTEFVRMEYISSFLLYVPFLILFFVLLPLMYRRADVWMKQMMVLMISWLLMPLLWVAIAATSWFPMPNHRLTDSYGYLPAGILLALVCHFIASHMPRKQLQIGVGVLLIAVVVIPSLYLQSIYTKQILAAQDSFDVHVFPTQGLWEGIMFLKTLPKESGIMVREPFGEVIPAFVDVKAYIGGIYNYADWLPRQWLAMQFFSGEMPVEEAATFLKNNNISYVFYGLDERNVNKTGDLYPALLQPIFSNQDVTVYKIENME